MIVISSTKKIVKYLLLEQSVDTTGFKNFIEIAVKSISQNTDVVSNPINQKNALLKATMMS